MLVLRFASTVNGNVTVRVRPNVLCILIEWHSVMLMQPTYRRRLRSHCPLQQCGGPHRLHTIRATGGLCISPKAQKKFGSCEV